MNKSKIKICGVKNTLTIDCCVNNFVDYFGLVFYRKSPRYVSLELTLELLNHSKFKKITPVGVFFNHQIDSLINIIEKTHLNHIQLHGNEDNNYIGLLKKEFDINVIKSIGIKEKIDFKKMEKLSNTDYYLFDYKPEITELPGGNAKKFNWSLLENIRINKPWFISGGINIDNIEEIPNNLIPYGIDISSGVEEKKGIKSSKKIEKILQKIHAK